MGQICGGTSNTKGNYKLGKNGEPYVKPPAVQKAHGKITSICSKNKSLELSESELRQLTELLGKMYGRFEKDNCQATTDHLFSIAREKVSGDDNKQIIDGLRQMIGAVEGSLYQPNPRYQDAFFFPNLENVKKL